MQTMIFRLRTALTPCNILSMSMELNDLLLTNISNWWFDKFIGPQMKDNGDRSEACFMAGGLAGILADQYPVHEYQRGYFKKALGKGLSSRDNLGFLRCDYGPDPFLREIMESVGIHGSRAPWKTTMRFGKEGISVIAGYHADEEFLWLWDGTSPVERTIVQYRSVYPQTDYSDAGEFVSKETFYTSRKFDTFVEDLNNSKVSENKSYQVYETHWREIRKDGKWVATNEEVQDAR